MARIVIVGDGPGGLSAALFLAKNGHEATVYGTDETALHAAYLRNYLGNPEILGSDFQRVAVQQVVAAGAVVDRQRVVAVKDGSPLSVTLEDGQSVVADYLILSEGKRAPLADEFGLEREDRAIAVDRDYRSSHDRVYVVGRSARPSRSQAIISAGAGATAAVDILAREAGKDVQDWDTPPEPGTASDDPPSKPG
jgi:thioredoxin reductase (NADPH)